MSALCRWRCGVALGLAMILLLACAVGGVALGAPPRGVAVLYPETHPPYRQIFADLLAGIEQGLSAETVRTRSLSDPPDVAALRRWLDQEAPVVVITLGRVPTETYEHIGRKTPHVIGALDASPQTRPTVAGVGLAVDPALLFGTLQLLMPEKRRVWVVFDPAYDRWLIALAQTAAAARNLKLESLEAGDLRESARQFLRILDTADPATDAIWLVADAGIIDSQTILPLVIEKSWQRRLPVFSNSLAHVKRGVLFALYPDNISLGRRLAELSLQALRTPDARAGVEVLRAVKRALNLKVVGHLELDVPPDIERQFDLVLPVW
jgi:putative ABC transport system substrate-binding protein